MALQAPEGTKDLLPDEARMTGALEARRPPTCSVRLRLCDYRDARLRADPELFVRGIGEATDVVSKEMFTAISGENLNKLLGGGTIKGKSRLSLRPEGTAGVVRAVVQHDLVPQGAAPAKLMYAGPMFRAERPQKGRQRQFNQVGIECPSGAEDPQRGRRGHHHAHALLRRHRHSRGRHAPSGELYRAARAVSPGVPRCREGVHGRACGRAVRRV